MEEAGGDVALGILLGIIDVFKSIYEWIKEHIFQPIIDGIKKVFGIHSPAEEMKPLGDNIAQGLLFGISNVFKSIKEWVDRNIMTPIVNAITAQMVKIKAVWDSLEQKITSVWAKVKLGAIDAWNGIKNVFSTVVTWFRDKFSAAWEAVKNVFSTGGRIFTGIKEGIETTFKNVVNKIIDGVNTVVSIPFNAINRFLNTLRNASILGVKPFGWIGSISIPRIPRLAQGGVVNPGHEFAAILGDNRHEQEIVSPLSTMKQALLEALQESGMSDGGQVILNIDGRQVATAIVPHMNNASRAYGRSVIR